ncbi:hypothetical protein [Xenorhabdus szentirmaii]|uniref:Lipoprotein n=1 Tax=Xenorhabdus szentirmaii DSM 16338 TaxID=1427518 RepID=W1IT55_9GAMM|nr:hypothetical protein [Xenorhabdus szentirmaii]PHM30540.1 lipoprotein [Xenorhabdus szentirmaii DSM 16338]CDL80998.1 conserved exported hypothetical protein [Xenorhabdus szentirmaii DSM 16338]
MKNRVILPSVLVVFSLLAGCSSTRLDVAASKEVPVNRMFWGSDKGNEGLKSQIIIKRDRGFVGSGCLQNIQLNGIKVAELEIGEKVTFYAPPGNYTFTTYLSGSAFCGSLISSLAVKILPNSSNIFRIAVVDGSAPKIIKDNDS